MVLHEKRVIQEVIDNRKAQLSNEDDKVSGTSKGQREAEEGALQEEAVYNAQDNIPRALCAQPHQSVHRRYFEGPVQQH